MSCDLSLVGGGRTLSVSEGPGWSKSGSQFTEDDALAQRVIKRLLGVERTMIEDAGWARSVWRCTLGRTLVGRTAAPPAVDAARGATRGVADAAGARWTSVAPP